MLESYKWDWDGMGWDGRKSLQALILRAPLCGANNGDDGDDSGDGDGAKMSIGN